MSITSQFSTVLSGLNKTIYNISINITNSLLRCNINWVISNLNKRKMKNILLVSTVLFTLMFMSCNDAPKSEDGHNDNEGVSKTNEVGADAHGEEGHNEEEGGQSEEEGEVELPQKKKKTIGKE